MVVTPEHAREAERAVLRWEGLVYRGKKLTLVATPAALSNWGAGGGILQVLCTLARSWWRPQPCYPLITLALCKKRKAGFQVLLYEHERCRGSRGIILNKQSEEGEILNWESQLFLGVQNSAALRHVSHGTGGSMKPEDWFILQRCSPSPGKCKHCTAETVRPKTCSKDWGREILPGIYLGKDVGPVLRHLNGCKRVSGFNHQSSDKLETIKEEKGRKSEECYNVDHQVIHGHAEWYVGQLASAVRRGLWKTRENASAILLSTPPHELWHTLLAE